MSKKLKLLCSLWFLVCVTLSAKMVDAWPQMVRADQSATITMVFEDEPLLEKPEQLALLYVNDDGLRSDGQPFQYGVKETIPFVIEGNTLKATLAFPGETIHTLTLVDPRRPERARRTLPLRRHAVPVLPRRSARLAHRVELALLRLRQDRGAALPPLQLPLLA